MWELAYAYSCLWWVGLDIAKKDDLDAHPEVEETDRLMKKPHKKVKFVVDICLKSATIT